MIISYWVKTVMKQGAVFACPVLERKSDGSAESMTPRGVDIDAAPDACLSANDVALLREVVNAAARLYGDAVESVNVHAAPGGRADWHDWIARRMRATYDPRPVEMMTEASGDTTPARHISAAMLSAHTAEAMRAISRGMAKYDIDFIESGLSPADDGE